MWTPDEIEKKWQSFWERKKLFLADVDDRPKYFITFPYPYLNGFLHLGHTYTLTRLDAFAKYKRMQGFNVLFPFAFHATGEPIVGVAKRIRSGDKQQISILASMGIDKRTIATFKDPLNIIKFFKKAIETDVKKLGCSIDWRCSFVTTTITPTYSRFIEWQYNKLKDAGYVVQGTHPVIWCDRCQSPTGDHDRLEGEGASPVEYILIKFKLVGEDLILPAATLRPETTYGVTNMWLNPDVLYVKIKVGEEKWLVSKPCVEKLKNQLKSVVVESEIYGKELIGKLCTNPLTNQEVLILPASFVDENCSSGVVMSVPAHAPYDWMGLKDLTKEICEKYNLDYENIRKISPISLIKTPGLSKYSAIDICETMKIQSQNDAKLESATNIIYKKEFHSGVLKDICGKFAGLKVSECKDAIVETFKAEGYFDSMYEVSENVICRCNNKCGVKILENQWFLDYANPRWKSKVRELLNNIEIFPKELEAQFAYTIDWLKEKACARKSGLGTPLPWDKSWIVETLSDSTIYMGYYILSKFVNKYKIKAEHLSDEVLDYIFLDGPFPKNPKIDKTILENIYKEFNYFYPLDMRGSGKDLVQNHLTFFLFHHAAIFPKKYLPRSVSVNGYVLIEGKKMSKSKGNFIILREALSTYGADVTRMNLLYSAEGTDDPDWRAKNALTLKKKLEAFYTMCIDIAHKERKEGELFQIDRWLLSRLQEKIEQVTHHFNQLEFRSALNLSFFDLLNDIKWYKKRVYAHEISPGRQLTINYVLYKVVSTMTKLLAPFIPHLCEEIWSNLSGKDSILVSSWPKPDSSFRDWRIEWAENQLIQIMNDLSEIEKIRGVKAKTIYLYVAPEWKYQALKVIKENLHLGKKDLIIKHIMKMAEFRKKGKLVVKLIDYIDKRRKLLEGILDKKEEMGYLTENKAFLEKEFNAKVIVFDADKSVYDPKKKALQSIPGKPGIYVE